MKSKLALLLLLIPSLYHAQNIKKPIENTNKTPKLIVGIVVDQMRFDFIYRYWNKFGERGFKRLVNGGFNCKNTNYNYVPTFTAPGHASIYTGTTPASHGIIANDWYSREKKSIIYCVTDKSCKTVGSQSKGGQVSPKSMLTTTIGDELRISNIQKSKVIGIALKDRSAILPAGHSANAAYWYDGTNASFITSSYYMDDLPTWVKNFNAQQKVEKYLQKGWNTLLPIEQYTESIPDENNYEKTPYKKDKPTFPYEYTKQLKDKEYEIIRHTPYGNSITKDFALEALKAEKLGKGEFTDMLCVSFSSTDYLGHLYGPKSVEIEDVYLRLDKDIEELLDGLDKGVGSQNYVLFLTADHGVCDVPAHLNDMKIPGGYVDHYQLEKDMKVYLKQLYGDSLVSCYIDQQIYLNDSVIVAKKINKVELEKVCAEFLLKEEGVGETYTANMLRTESCNEGSFKYLIQKGYNFKRSGDIALSLLPAWMELKDKGTTHGAEFSYDTHVPLIFYGVGIPKGNTVKQINIIDIAPSICTLLNIPFPNACTGKPIPALFNEK